MGQWDKTQATLEVWSDLEVTVEEVTHNYWDKMRGFDVSIIEKFEHTSK